MTLPLLERLTLFIVLGIGCLLLLSLGLAAWDQRQKREAAQESLRITREVIRQLDHLDAAVQRSTIAMQDFLLTKDSAHLTQFRTAAITVPSALRPLQLRYEASPHDENRIAKLRTLLEVHTHEQDQILLLATKDPTRVRQEFGLEGHLRRLQQIEALLAELRLAEVQQLEQAVEDEHQTRARGYDALIAGNVLALLLIGSALVLIIRDSRVKEQAEALTSQARVVDLAPILIRSMDGRILSWSQGCQQLYGYRQEEAVGQISGELLRTRTTVPLEDIHATLLREGRWVGEVLQTTRDGQTLVGSATWTIFTDRQGHPTSVVELTTDLTGLKAAQAAQAESEFRFQLLADHMSQLAWITDESGSIIWYNQRWYEYTGTTFEEMRGWGWQRVHHPDYVQQVVDKIRHAFQAGTTWEDTFPLRSRHGTYRWFLSRAVPVRHADGRVAQWFGTNTDITELRQAQLAQAWHAAIAEGSTDAMIGKSLDGTILSWNLGATTLFGYAANEMIGRSIDRLVPPELLEEDHRCRAMVQDGHHVPHFETYRLHRNGQRIHVSTSLSPVKNSSDVIIGVSQLIHDITDQKQTELALSESEERFRTLTAAIPQIVWSSTEDGACDYLSEQWEQYTGRSRGDDLGWGWLEAFHPEDRPAIQQRWQRSVATGTPYVGEYRLQARDGTYQWFLIQGTVGLGPKGVGTKWFGSCTNISEQKENTTALERINRLLQSRTEELAEANKELEAFSYSVSHDLRAPLRTITGFAQALIEDYREQLEPGAIRYLTIIIQGARQLGHLVDDLLNFSRLARQRLELYPVDLNPLITDVQAELASEQESRTIEWHLHDLPLCRADRTTIKLVLANLLGNALKYSRPRPIARIEIGWEPDDQQPGYARVWVKDNGVGFDMRYADKLFVVFQRLHPADAFEGTGVGLAIVQRIIQRHGGRVGGEGQPNEGATFWFALELAV